MNKTRTLRLFFLLSISPLLLGLLVYLCIGSTQTGLFLFTSNLLGPELVSLIRLEGSLPLFIQFHLADSLWAFALTSTLYLLLYNEMQRMKLLIIAVVASASFELLQYVNLIGGTADLFDLGFMLAASGLAYFLFSKKLLPCETTSYSSEP